MVLTIVMKMSDRRLVQIIFSSSSELWVVNVLFNKQLSHWTEFRRMLDLNRFMLSAVFFTAQILGITGKKESCPKFVRPDLQNLYNLQQISFVRCTGLEPVTPALSRRCSEPTELTTRFNCKISILSQFIKCQPDLIWSWQMKASINVH